MNTKKSRVQAVEEFSYGTYVWEIDGKWIADDEGRMLCVAAEKNDPEKLGALKSAAHNYLLDMGEEPRGKAVFLSGHRPVSDEQYDVQKARQEAGLTPDPFDVGAMQDELAEARKNGGRIL